MPDSSHPFVSRKAQVIFYLTQTDGALRCDALKITQSHYAHDRIAKQWFEDLMRDLGPRDAENAAAIDKLHDMYKLMTLHSDEE